MAIRFAASFSVRPCARTSFTASSRNSGVYVLGFIICAPFGEVYQKGVSEKVRLPQVTSYADGVWLAFTTVATVGYGDIVPSTPASKIFAFFIVLLGYAMFSFVTANIAALFVGEEEEIFEQELHNDIRALHQEVAALREELRRRDGSKSEGLPLSDSEIVVMHK
nr:potassium channel family protein [uncultured Undibacterium sp.]